MSEPVEAVGLATRGGKSEAGACAISGGAPGKDGKCNCVFRFCIILLLFFGCFLSGVLFVTCISNGKYKLIKYVFECFLF